GQHLTSDRVRASEKPQFTLRYDLPMATRRALREADPRDDPENKREDEFLLRFAQTILANAGHAGRVELLANLKSTVDSVGGAEMKRVVSELKGLGVDWNVGEDKGASDTEVVVTTNRENNHVIAGEPFSLTVKVTNRGKAPLYQLRAKTKSDYALFNDRELLFGKLMPGQTREWTAPLGICEGEGAARKCALPKNVLARADGIHIAFEEAHGHAPAKSEVRTTIEALPRPRFAYAYQVVDGRPGEAPSPGTPVGNMDGRVQKGEPVTVYFRVKNAGVGKSFKTNATVRNLSGRGVSLKDGRFSLDTMNPGDEREVKFTLDVLGDYERDEVKLEVSVYDSELREIATERINLALAREPLALKSVTGPVSINANARLFAAPSDSADVVGTTDGGPVAATQVAQAGGFVRVNVAEGRPVWVKQSDLGKAGGASGKLAWRVDRMPPALDVDYGKTLVVRGSSLPVQGLVKDDRRVRDSYVFVGPRKVFYDATKNGAKSMNFKTDLPLRPGMNYITVVARESQDMTSRVTFVVRRDGADGALLESPKHADEFDWSDDEDESGPVLPE
ncbi:MAG: hypothetical protein KC417_09795, partial [Myxococcales bacterium]|nr:hypothetical protein [Myxococcales bacterium]